jgi:ankyrin repeat protein
MPSFLSLCEACHEGNVGAVKQILYTHPDMNPAAEVDGNGFTPFYIACRKGHVEIATLLCGHCEIPLNELDKNGCAPLFFACYNGHVQIVQLLCCQTEINLEVATPTGDTPLLIASQEGHIEVVKVLLAHNANFEVLNHEGNSPFMMACAGGHTAVVDAFLSMTSVDASQSDQYGSTPLLVACHEGHTDIVELLLAKEIMTETPDLAGNTPLSAAYKQGHAAIVQLLLSHDSSALQKEVSENGDKYDDNENYDCDRKRTKPLVGSCLFKEVEVDEKEEEEDDDDDRGDRQSSLVWLGASGLLAVAVVGLGGLLRTTATAAATSRR